MTLQFKASFEGLTFRAYEIKRHYLGRKCRANLSVAMQYHFSIVPSSILSRILAAIYCSRISRYGRNQFDFIVRRCVGLSVVNALLKSPFEAPHTESRLEYQ